MQESVERDQHCISAENLSKIDVDGVVSLIGKRLPLLRERARLLREVRVSWRLVDWRPSTTVSRLSCPRVFLECWRPDTADCRLGACCSSSIPVKPAASLSALGAPQSSWLAY